MNKKRVLIVDEDSHRAEKLVFIVRLGGYEARTFSNDAAALNWVKYGCPEEETLCLLINYFGGLERAEAIVAAWTATGITLPVVLLPRGKECGINLLAIGESDQFFVCEPESVMQMLDILTEIAACDRLDAGKYSKKMTRFEGDVARCK